MRDKGRNYKKEYEEYQSKPEQIKNRSMRNKARKELGLKKGDPREADHVRPLSKGGSNAKSNLRAVSRETNRKKGNSTDDNQKICKLILERLLDINKRIDILLKN